MIAVAYVGLRNSFKAPTAMIAATAVAVVRDQSRSLVVQRTNVSKLFYQFSPTIERRGKRERGERGEKSESVGDRPTHTNDLPDYGVHRTSYVRQFLDTSYGVFITNIRG